MITDNIIEICGAETERSFRSYANYLYGYLASMFNWKCDFAPEWIFEYYLTTRGHAAIYYGTDVDKPTVICGGYTGTPTEYMVGSQYVGSTRNGKTYTGTVGENVAVIWNNLTLSSDIPVLSAYAKRFVESDKSILNVLRGARITALVTASDNTDKQTLDNVVKSIDNGDTVVKIPPLHSEIDALDTGAKRFDVLRITDPKDTDKLQYLTRYRDDLLAAFLNEYGIDVNVVNKGSQVTRDELHSMGAAVSAVIEQRKRCRERELDLVRSWGYEISVSVGAGRGNTQTDEQSADEQNGEDNDDEQNTNDN